MDRSTIHRRRWAILGVLVISLLVVVLDNTILNVALRVLSDPHQGLGATQSQLAWAINSYTLVFAGLLFTWGVIGDRFGRKRILVLGMLLFGLSSFASAYAQTPEQLIWARALKGLGGAAVMPQTLSIITNVFDPEERGRAIGVWAGAVGLAMGIGPPLGGLLLEHFWWGSVFLINVPVVAVGLVLMVVLVPESRNERPGGFDPLGVVLSILGLVLLVYGIIRAGEEGVLADPLVLGSVLAGLAVLALFAWHEARTASPALDVRLFRDPRLAVAIAAIMLVFFAMAGVMFFINFYLQSVRAYSPLHAGLLVIPIALAQLVFSPLSPLLVARFGPKAVCSTGLALVATALGSYALLGRDTPIWILEAVFFLQGAGMAIVMTPATESIMSSVPRHQAGAASAVQNTVRQVATALGVAVLGAVVSAVYRAEFGPWLSRLPEDARAAAGASIEGTLAIAREAGPAGQGMVEPAKQAFLAGMHVAALCSLGVALAGLVIVMIWLPRHGRPVGNRDARPVEVGHSRTGPRERGSPASPPDDPDE
ncbi:MFS transporter [Marinactinospora thermotolerans]|uniref:Drug resistance transporter, EmrB/QacA subfamily n=1 Tax=Marinactinospora thermotolerans DSM 45154 TaxID=1122192 RepID=A0A1T4MAR0_9ACTN|nr:MFS transporter [Marinactinospora thermotolerans]SJZ64130.1 drug resistance transporter, EmrB/QacA subfamily [Marinactinospora thermotolerans DSM 45154]